MPPCWSFGWRLTCEEVLPAQAIEVESTEAEKWVVQVVLHPERELRDRIIRQNAIIVCAS